MPNLAIICHGTDLERGMGLFLNRCHRLICIVLSLCKHTCKEVCDVKQGIDPYPLLALSCDRCYGAIGEVVLTVLYRVRVVVILWLL